MYDFSEFDPYLERNKNGIGRHTTPDIPKNLYERLKEIDKDYFMRFKTHLFQEFRVEGDGDIVYEAKMKAEANKHDKDGLNDRIDLNK